MAYNLPANTILELRVVGQLHGQQTINTFHYQNDSAITDARPALAQYLQDFETNIYNPLVALMSEQWFCEYLSLQPIHPIRYQPMLRNPIVAGGVVTEDSVPSTTAVCLQRKAERASRRDQGRVFIPGLPVTSEAESQLTIAVSDDWDDVAEEMAVHQLESALTDSLLLPVLFNLDNPSIDVFTVSGRADRVLRVQRRREVGRGS